MSPSASKLDQLVLACQFGVVAIIDCISILTPIAQPDMRHLLSAVDFHIKQLEKRNRLRLISGFAGLKSRPLYECLRCGDVDFLDALTAQRGRGLKFCSCHALHRSGTPASKAYRARLPGETIEEHSRRVTQIEQDNPA